MSTKSQISTETPSPTVPKPSHFPTTGLAFVVVIATIANIAANWLIAQESKISDRENTSSVARAIEKSNESATIQFGNTENFELYKKVQALKAPEINKQIQAELSKAQ